MSFKETRLIFVWVAEEERRAAVKSRKEAEAKRLAREQAKDNREKL